MKRKLSIILGSVCLLAGCAGPESEMDRYINELMGKMTVEEKIGQLNLPVTGDIVTGQAKSSNVSERIRRGEVGGLFNLKGVDKIREVQKIAVEESRLGIPLLFGMDVIHGYETVFPIPLGLSCSWDMDAVELSARIAATEASADGICWTFSPMVDIARDARWGRISEGSGEDTFLGCRIAEAMVKGYQGPVKESQLTEDDQIMACVKHFALYGAPEAGRDYNTVDMSHIRMYNEYLPPYKAALDAGAGSMMASFNEVDGVPATGNRWLLTDVLRNQWGFDGFVVTDYTGIEEMTKHGIGDFEQVSLQALQAGVDMDMVSEGFILHVKNGLDKGLVSMKDLDLACRRILEAKYKLGLFSDPYKYCKKGRAEKEVYCEEHRAAARKIASESFVLLKNDGTLPLAKKGKIALIGPLANTKSNMPGTWSVAAKLNVPSTLKESLTKAVAGKAEVIYAKGSNLTEDAALEARSTMFGRELGRDSRTDAQLLEEAMAAARKADVIVAALGEASEMSGESSCRTDISIPDVQKKLLKKLVATGKPVVLVLFNGRPLTIEWEAANVPAILDVWFGGSEAADAICDVLFGDVNPSGKLTTSFPKNVGQVPMYYAHKNTGRPLGEGRWFEKFRSNYLDVDNDPLYPFGYGLSYTSFEYSDITLSTSEINPGQTATASVTVTNTGKRAGKEVVQMYICDVVGTTTRPVRELKGFEKICLEPGESKTVTFDITEELLSYWNSDLKFTAEPGEFKVYIGTDSTTSNEATLTLR
ncbi:MAG: beta-glucosidase BglX [Candidatus Cryptobacteroides sp.]